MAKRKSTKKKEVGKVPPPYPLAMVVCDYIHRDPGTAKPTILGCFSVIHAIKFPATHSMMGLYIEVTNGRGKVPFRVQLIDADEEREPIWFVEDELEFPDPRMVMQMNFLLGGVTFAAPGEYRFQLFASGEFLMERRILINQLIPPEQETNDE